MIQQLFSFLYLGTVSVKLVLVQNVTELKLHKYSLCVCLCVSFISVIFGLFMK